MIETLTVDYKRILKVDLEIIDLLERLTRFPIESIIKSIDAGYLTALKVYLNGELCGLIIARAEIDYWGDATFVVVHVIAHKTNLAFHKILGESLWNFVRSQQIPLKNGETKNFRYIRHHADTPGLCRLLEKYYNEIQEIIFVKDLTREDSNGKRKLGIKYFQRD